jgi:putative oxidoreductase
MSDQITFPASRGYVVGTMASMVLYVIGIVGLSWSVPRGYLHGPAMYAAILVPSLAIALQLLVTMRYLGRVDEYVRGVMTKRFLVAAMLACIVATTWGFFETYAAAPHQPGWLIYPLFWGLFGVVTPFIRTSR